MRGIPENSQRRKPDEVARLQQPSLFAKSQCEHKQRTAGPLSEKRFLSGIELGCIGMPAKNALVGSDNEGFAPILVHAQEQSPLPSCIGRLHFLRIAAVGGQPFAGLAKLDANSPGIVSGVKYGSAHARYFCCGSDQEIKRLTPPLYILDSVRSFQEAN